MSNPFESSTFVQVTLEDVAWLLGHFPFTRHINAIHLHHSGRPNHRQYRGRETILEIARLHQEQYGFCTIAQHLSVAPDGSIWLGRNWNVPPASAAGHNGSAVSGPLMITMIGDFDQGQDLLTFDGDAPWQGRADPEGEKQGNATLRLIALIQHHFGLDVESLHFQRDLSKGTSPGNSIDYSYYLRELRKVRTLLRKADKEGNGYKLATTVSPYLPLLLDNFSKSGSIGNDGALAEVEALVAGSRDYTLFVDKRGVTLPALDRGFAGPEITPAMLDEIAPYTVNLTMGHFSQDGVMQSSKADVDAIFEEHLVRAYTNRKQDQPLRIVFYAHGGLVGERQALLQAYQHTRWWQQNGVYPIYFVWETGLWPMFWQSLIATRDRTLAREAFTDGFLEELARGLGGPRTWQAIKNSAATATLDPAGGAHYVMEKLQDFLESRKAHVELHAVGHSAGAIFHSYFVPAIVGKGIGTFRTVQFLAPAITVADFKTQVMDYMGKGIEQLPIFTMRKELERSDPTASPWYNRSILYLVSHAMEPVRNTPVLGLEESLRADVELREHFGLRGRAAQHGEVIWSTTLAGSGRSASGAVQHGSFNCDQATMNSVLRRVLDADDNDPIREYPSSAACNGRSLTPGVELTPPLARLAAEGLFNPTALLDSRPVVTTLNGSGKRGGGDGQPPIGGGRRRALCVGIDNYTSSPLSGCIADAQLWAATLQQLGFEAPQLLLDGAATRQGIMTALSNLLTSSRAGDVIVFQYAGHGIEFPDLNGDEAEQGSTSDQAICPFDFHDGAYLIDDDLAMLFAQTPAGVNVTCFLDCCHSGTATRFAVGNAGSAVAVTEHARYLRATPDRIEAHHRYRRGIGYQRAVRSRGPATMREVVFSACLPSEVALESNGHGHFTLRATELLRSGLDGVTNEQFVRNVLDGFGPARRQNPMLDCPPGTHSNLLLQPISQSMLAGTEKAWRPGLLTATANGQGQTHASDALYDPRVLELLQQIVSLLGGKITNG